MFLFFSTDDRRGVQKQAGRGLACNRLLSVFSGDAMCRDVEYNNEYISDVDTLSDRLGPPVIIYDDDEPLAGECLCNCDIPAMAKAAGKTCEQTNDPFVPFKIDG